MVIYDNGNLMDGDADDGDDDYGGCDDITKSDLWCWCSALVHFNLQCIGQLDLQNQMGRRKGVESLW